MNKLSATPQRQPHLDSPPDPPAPYHTSSPTSHPFLVNAKEAPMRRHRPGSVTTFAILNLVFGGLLLTCGLLSIPEQKMTVNNQDISQQLNDFMAGEIPGYAVWRFGSLAIDLILGVGFIVSGVGLLQFRGWGRVLALVCAGLAIFNQL